MTTSASQHKLVGFWLPSSFGTHIFLERRLFCSVSMGTLSGKRELEAAHNLMAKTKKILNSAILNLCESFYLICDFSYSENRGVSQLIIQQQMYILSIIFITILSYVERGLSLVSK